jgi:hypothetical protein
VVRSHRQRGGYEDARAGRHHEDGPRSSRYHEDEGPRSTRYHEDEGPRSARYYEDRAEGRWQEERGRAEESPRQDNRGRDASVTDHYHEAHR